MTLLTALDYPDPDVIRVGDTYYMISTTMHFFPGGELLQSKDLVHWERLGHVFSTLEDNPAHRLEEGQNIYGKGMWAASLRYHRGQFYVCFVANDTGRTYLFVADHAQGPWTRRPLTGFYHDPSLLFDEDRVYIAYGNREIRITELRADLSGPLEGGLDRVAVTEVNNGLLSYEGSHLYRIEGRYYLFLIHSRPDRWRRVQACFVADRLDGEFRGRDVLDADLGYDEQGVAQGGVVDTPDGRWFSVLFQDRGAVGRIPVLVPLTWVDGFPVLHPEPSPPPRPALDALTGSDDFRGELGPFWQWNHNPNLALVSLDARAGALMVQTGALAESLTQTPNVLTQRARFPGCSVEVTVDGSDLKPGDRAGLCALQGAYGWIAVVRDEAGWAVVMGHRPTADVSSRPLGPGQAPEVQADRSRLRLPRLRLRMTLRFAATGDWADFWYFDEDQWRRLGPSHRLVFKLDHFTGCRIGLFVQATQAVGGAARFQDFVYQTPWPAQP